MLAHVKVVVNCGYSVAHMCTHEETLSHNLGASSYDDDMSHNELTTIPILILALLCKYELAHKLCITNCAILKLSRNNNYGKCVH